MVGLAAASITVIAGQAAQAATPPNFPNNIVVFPQRDFVTIEGYANHVGENATVVVTRNGVETSRAVGRVAAGDVALEINHPGGVCWQGVTPDIKPNDVVRVSFPTGASDSTITQSPEVTPQAGEGFRTVGAFDLVVEGKRARRLPALAHRTAHRRPGPEGHGCGSPRHPRAVTSWSVHVNTHRPDVHHLPRELPLRDRR